MDYLQDKVVLITGAARGIGFATAKLLGGRGAKVVVSDVIDDALQEAEKNLQADGVEALAVRSDVTDYHECEVLVKAAVDRFGKIDVLINIAGVSIVAEFVDCRP